MKYKYIYKIIFVFLLATQLLSCASQNVEITNPVTWYAVNGWDDMVSFTVFDQVCERYLGVQRLRARREAEMTSCGDERGNASIRYRREGLAPGSSWSMQSGVRNGARIFMR